MKKLIMLFLLIALWMPAAMAQVNIEQIDINGPGGTDALTKEDLISHYGDVTPIPDLLELGIDANHVANITMAGNNNTASITQQNGSLNIGAIHILGNGNDTHLAQKGSDLLSLIDIEGDTNLLNMNQSGSNLGNLVQVLGSGLHVSLTQDNTGFRYTQNGTSTPIIITSTSDYVPIIIENN